MYPGAPRAWLPLSTLCAGKESMWEESLYSNDHVAEAGPAPDAAAPGSLRRPFSARKNIQVQDTP